MLLQPRHSPARPRGSLFSSRCKPADNQTDEIISTQSRVQLSRGDRNMVGASQARWHDCPAGYQSGLGKSRQWTLPHLVRPYGFARTV